MINRFWDVAAKLTVAGTLALTGAAITHEWRLRVLEAEDLPPKWLVESVGDIKMNQKDMDVMLHRIQGDVADLKAIHKAEARGK